MLFRIYYWHVNVSCFSGHFVVKIAAHQLEQEARQWESKNNEMVDAATRMAGLMIKMARFTRFINVAIPF